MMATFLIASIDASITHKCHFSQYTLAFCIFGRFDRFLMVFNEYAFFGDLCSKVSCIFLDISQEDPPPDETKNV
jgi:hypothetical protein